MTVRNPEYLAVGDKLRFSYVTSLPRTVTIKGHVAQATDEGNYVKVHWTNSRRGDIIARTSPLWHLLELDK